jgi:hypothetical protein
LSNTNIHIGVEIFEKSYRDVPIGCVPRSTAATVWLKPSSNMAPLHSVEVVQFAGVYAAVAYPRMLPDVVISIIVTG